MQEVDDEDDNNGITEIGPPPWSDLYLRRDGGVITPRQQYFATDFRILVPIRNSQDSEPRWYSRWDSSRKSRAAQGRQSWYKRIRRWPSSDWRVQRYRDPRDFARKVISDLYLRLTRKIELEALRVLLLGARFGTVSVQVDDDDWSIAASTADLRLRTTEVLQDWVHLVLRALSLIHI